MAVLQRHVVAILILVLGIFAHVFTLVLSSESHFVWKLGALAQLYHDSSSSETRYTAGWAKGSASRTGEEKKRRSKGSNVVPIEVNRQFEIVSVESPIHSEYIKCCPEDLPSLEVDYVCTCASEEGEENGYVARIWKLEGELKEKYANKPQKKSSWSLEVTPVEEIKNMADQVLSEMKEAGEAREDVLNSNNSNYTQFEWFLQNKDNLGSIRDTIEAATANADATAASVKASGFDPNLLMEQRSNFDFFDKKFHLWCEDQESKDLIERRFYFSDGLREYIFNRTRCEADEYDLDQGCARDVNQSRGRATNNGILEAEQAEKAKLKPKYRYESVVTLRGDQKIDVIMQSLAQTGGGEDKMEDEDNTTSSNSSRFEVDAADHPKLVQSFETLDKIKSTKGEDLAELIETCLATKRMEFLELFVRSLEEEVVRDEEAKKKIEESRKKAAEAKRKADDAKKRSSRRRRKAPEQATTTSTPSTSSNVNATQASDQNLLSSNKSGSSNMKNNVTQPRNASATTRSSPPARRGQAERNRNRNRSKRARSRSVPNNNVANPTGSVANSTTNSSSIPAGSSATEKRQFHREKRAKQRELKKAEELCHTLYQAALKLILTGSSNKKGLHSQLLLAETDKQTCLRRVRKKIADEIESIGKDFGQG